jgi:hypothetical protein
LSFNRRTTTGSLDPVRVRTDGSKTEKADPTEERLRARVKKNSAYEKYKASLHEFFDGDKPLPDNLKAILATRPGAAAHLGEEAVAEQEAAEAEAASSAPVTKRSKKKEKSRDGERRTRRRVSTRDDYGPLVEAVRKSNSPREVEGAVDALLGAGYELPGDADILSKALGHSNEDVIEKALSGLLEVADSGQIKSKSLLRTRIDNVALLASSRSVSSLCDELKDKLK